MADQQHSTVALLNESGAVVERYGYDAFWTPAFYDGSGAPIAGTACGNTRLYTGREWLPALGLYDYRQRPYAPGLGRFLTRDPACDPANLGNPYTYVANNPYAFVDPYGQERWGAQSYWRESLDVGYGYFIVGPIDAVTGVATAVAHPIRTAQGIASLAGGLAADPLGAAGNLARLFYTQFEDSDTAGQATFGASTAIVPGAAGAAKTAASRLQAGRRILSTSRGARTVTTAEAAVAGRAATQSRVLANIKASKDARRVSQFDVHLAVEDIYTNANKAVAAAKEAGLTNQHGALGMRAHQEFVKLNKAASERLAGRGIHIEVEPYADRFGLEARRAAKGSLSADALLEYRGANVRGFDLKTGRPWSRAGLQERIDRFGVPVRQLRY